jgi:hypothetical protein
VTPATKNQHSDTHRILNKNLLRQQHQSPATHTTEEDPESYRRQTNNALASLLLARNNNCPQQIWRLRLLQLQQQQLLSDLHPTNRRNSHYTDYHLTFATNCRTFTDRFTESPWRTQRIWQLWKPWRPWWAWRPQRTWTTRRRPCCSSRPSRSRSTHQPR